MKIKKIITVLILISVTIALGLSFYVIKDKKEKNDLYKIRVDKIEKASKNWVKQNEQLFNESGTTYLNIKELVKDNLIAVEDTIDPKTNEQIKGCIIIEYDKKDNTYTFTVDKDKFYLNQTIKVTVLNTNQEYVLEDKGSLILNILTKAKYNSVTSDGTLEYIFDIGNATYYIYPDKNKIIRDSMEANIKESEMQNIVTFINNN